MKKFSELGVKPVLKGLTGDKIKMDRILNREITVHDFRIVESKFAGKGNGRCLHMQIRLGDTEHVIFTGSGVLMDTIEQIPKTAFPFSTTIVRDNDRFEFS